MVAAAAFLAASTLMRTVIMAWLLRTSDARAQVQVQREAAVSVPVFHSGDDSEGKLAFFCGRLRVSAVGGSCTFNSGDDNGGRFALCLSRKEFLRLPLSRVFASCLSRRGLGYTHTEVSAGLPGFLCYGSLSPWIERGVSVLLS